MAFWRRLLEGTSWQTLVGYVSPAFFQLVSPRDVSRTAYRLIRNWFDDNGFRAAVQQRATSVAQLDAGLTIVAPSRRRDRRAFASDAPACAELGTERTGEAALTFFFHQIYSEGPVLLDLRRSHFCPRGERLQFTATPLYCHWAPPFRAALRDLYTAFYDESAGARLAAALDALGIAPAADAFERAFGGERKRAAHFQLSEFRTTFHEIFLRCLETRKTLQPDFLTLGIAIATLYDHLELDGGTYDVAACHALAVSRTSS